MQSDQGNSEFPYPYVCSLSPLLRAGVLAMGAQQKIQEVTEGVVTDIATNAEVAVSLQAPSPLGMQTFRQIDIRPHSGSDVVLLKCFTRWDAKNERWHVLIEGSKETYFDDKKGMVNRG